MSEEYEEVIDIKKILIIAGIVGAGLIGFSVFLYFNGMTIDSPQISPNTQTTKQPQPQQDNFFTDLFKPKEVVVNPEALNAAAEEEKIRLAELAEKTQKEEQLLAENQAVITQYVEYGLPEETIKQIIVADCNILFNGTRETLAETNSAIPTNDTTTLENGTEIPSITYKDLGKEYEGLFLVKEKLCQ